MVAEMLTIPSRWPIMMYEESGIRVTNQLWDETLEELSFAKLDVILKGMER
jgi:hypothetical protein